MKRLVLLLGVLTLTWLPIGCAGSQPTPGTAAAVPFPAIDGAMVLEHTKVLSSDEYEGRAPGTRGEDLTVAYITDQFAKAGLKPGNTDGTYIQKVPLVGITVDQTASLAFGKDGKDRTLKFRDDFVAWTKHVAETVSLEKSPVVFVGYGIEAPEFAWDDYKGLDLKGKTLMVLVGDPPIRDPNDASQLDPKMFGGRAMTYYGRWTYKFEMGALKGAAGVLIVHETDAAGYPFSVVQGMTGERFDLIAPDKNASRTAVEGWLSLDQARALCTMAGQDYAALKKAALSREFKPVPLGMTASITLHNKLRTIDSRNVVGKVDGADPTLKSEYVIYTSHWDHFGIGPAINGETIYHGAQDNATGIGGIIEMARAYVSLPTPPKRSIVFLAVTAEEQMLLGSEYYARNPIYPLARTLAVINIDSLNVHGKTSDVTITGMGKSDLEDYAGQVAADQQRVVKPDPTPEKGGYYRSDHFPFAKAGVPALASGDGIDYMGKPPEYGTKIRDDYTINDYHKPSDRIRPDWDMSGAVESLQYYWMIGYRVAQAEKYPQWKPGAEFKPVRDAQLKAAGIGER